MLFRPALAWLFWTTLLLVPRAVFAADPDGMVWVAEGDFIMGQDPADGRVGVDVGVDSLPRHVVHLEGFWMDRTEVTVADYRAFVNANSAYRYPMSADASLAPDAPAVGVTYGEAEAYCAWKGKRLPTEAEWEKAARGTDGRTYPWGNDWDPARVNYEQSAARRPEPVGTHPDNASPYGVLDMAGNAMEWTSSWYQAYPGNPLKRQAFGQQFKVLRGGSWESDPLFLRAANRFAVLPVIGQPSFGLRCVQPRQR